MCESVFESLEWKVSQRNLYIHKYVIKQLCVQ